MRTKYYYYVGVQTDKGMMFITKDDYKTRMSFWNEKEKPLAMSRDMAQDIALGLCLNCHCAVVVQSLFELAEHFIATDGENTSETENV